ncbi:MAG: response regulator transcription factor [Ferruginibacter sp.]
MDKKNTLIKVAMADDHVLLRDALANLINNFNNCRVTIASNNGKELTQAIANGQVPDVVILDLNMPVMNGYDTALWLQKNQPGIKILMLTMYDSEIALIRLLQSGVKGFLKKDIHPNELQFAIQQVVQSGFYYSQNTTGRLAGLFRRGDDNELALQKSILGDIEIEFLKLSCTEMTYKEIASSMNLNPRSVDNLRDNLFSKLDVKSRIGLAMYAIKHGLVSF